MPEFELIEVYRAAGEMEARIVIGLLEANGIPAFIKSHASPSVHAFTVDGLGEFRVVVSSDLAERAKELINAGNAEP